MQVWIVSFIPQCPSCQIRRLRAIGADAIWAWGRCRRMAWLMAITCHVSGGRAQGSQGERVRGGERKGMMKVMGVMEARGDGGSAGFLAGRIPGTQEHVPHPRLLLRPSRAAQKRHRGASAMTLNPTLVLFWRTGIGIATNQPAAAEGRGRRRKKTAEGRRRPQKATEGHRRPQKAVECPQGACTRT